jgi:hypothetical protein
MAKRNYNNSVYLIFLFFSLFYLGSNSNLRLKKLTKKLEKLKNTKVLMQTNAKQSYQFSNAKDNLSVIGTCTDTNCKDPYGHCLNSFTCLCSPGYAQDYNQPASQDSPICSYKLKTQAVFLMLEFFFWFGIGHFYAGRWLYGLLKLLYIAGIILIDCLTKIPLKSKTNKFQRFWYSFIYVLYFSILIWQLFDIIMIGLNKFYDGNGMQFYTWDYAIS